MEIEIIGDEIWADGWKVATLSARIPETVKAKFIEALEEISDEQDLIEELRDQIDELEEVIARGEC